MTDSEKVRTHYELAPYPSRDPADEKKRLITGSPSHLLEVNHYLFKGARDFSKPFRALIAGGGTGDAAIMVAQQLADRGQKGEVIYLDLSGPSRKIAEERAKVRELKNITFLTASLLDVEELGIGPFDYIDCCGVLHHLPDPKAGLAALKSVLGPGGGVGLMLYGALGRRGIYETQAMLQQLCGQEPINDRIDLARRLLKALPDTNWLKRNPFLGDHKIGDAELADLLLHPLDRAYKVPEILDLAASAQLKLVSFIAPVRYRPETYIKDPTLLKNLEALSDEVLAAFAEGLAGNMKTHSFYLTSSRHDTVARPDGENAIPHLLTQSGKDLAKGVQERLAMKVDLAGLQVSFPLPVLAPAILRQVDGEKDLRAIYETMALINSN
ncbi:MAG: class I SAM-dependent methyltransferase, partial [Kiloniellales bacterium]|nr:class I SAM-dependent methyltransferase [Kiloniellales bacterium]